MHSAVVDIHQRTDGMTKLWRRGVNKMLWKLHICIQSKPWMQLRLCLVILICMRVLMPKCGNFQSANYWPINQLHVKYMNLCCNRHASGKLSVCVRWILELVDKDAASRFLIVRSIHLLCSPNCWMTDRRNKSSFHSLLWKLIFEDFPWYLWPWAYCR